ncbi:Ankyrin repeat domain-containing protein 6-like protein [Leptotrombidium deliense]|uniref:Ankyrin repeat domain-containing protein 6-like protein n=1 Tax=Leptotrombidium deliense TaxID=299467 RepID=A0A443SWA4_9ACAR|nr:Ankyrin repeat domain-containing protein 6-like protein [Leptotrombidium deliense]
MPFSNVSKERQRQKSCAIIRENGDLIAINSSIEALRQASAVGNFEVVRELCLKSVPITADSSGKTALHYAATTGHLQIVNELIVNMGNLNAKDNSGYAPLHLAATEGHVDVVKLLLRSGSHIDAVDEIVSFKANAAITK